MKKFIYFLKWLFDIKSWKSYNIRFTLYTLTGVLVSIFAKEFWYGPLVVFVLMFGELTIDHFIVSKWKEFNEEQNKIFEKLQK